MTWHWIALVTVSYLAATAMFRREFAPVRARVFLGAAVIAGLIALDWRFEPFGRAGAVILPSLALLAGYRLSGLFFVRIDFPAEAWLLDNDRRLLHQTGLLERYDRMPRVVPEFLELTYFLVYPALPIGAAVLTLSGHADVVDRYWTVVLTAGLLCYGTLPWLQTRPPMLLEARPAARQPGPIRRFNQLVSANASVRACTIPSGHAACGLAAALTITSALPGTGAIFLLHALTLATASVLGRYHYTVDSALGVLLALATFALL